jgi:lipoprotein-anchoring transpeptidase ErfK/SrfK
LLSALGYWITKVDGVADSSTRHAIVAFQKVERRKRTGVLNDAELRAMRGAASPQPRSTGERHLEIDLTRQVLFLVNESGVITHILPVSSGNEKKYFDQGKWQIAHTPRGNFRITRQIDGVRRAPLGALYYPSYFSGGVAVHGSNSVPVYPASHGCVRIPNFAARDLLKMVPVGTPVSVYD